MAHESEASVGTLIRGALDDMRELIREEVLLAKAEIRQETGKLTSAAVQFGIAGGALFFAGMFLLVTVALGIAALFNWPAWAGFGIVAVLLGVVGVVMLSSGRRSLRTVEPLPRTVHSIKENLQ
jgi:Flp pilus assembly protein TadB